MKDYKTIRVDVPSELYERFKKFVKKEYDNPTSKVRGFIANYVKEKEKEYGE